LKNQLLSRPQSLQVVKKANGEDQDRWHKKRQDRRLKNKAKLGTAAELRTAPKAVLGDCQCHGIRQHDTDPAEAWYGVNVCFPAAVRTVGTIQARKNIP
jgi:hypothetical protein